LQHRCRPGGRAPQRGEHDLLRSCWT
jgi:hypothetical protein